MYILSLYYSTACILHFFYTFNILLPFFVNAHACACLIARIAFCNINSSGNSRSSNNSSYCCYVRMRIITPTIKDNINKNLIIQWIQSIKIKICINQIIYKIPIYKIYLLFLYFIYYCITIIYLLYLAYYYFYNFIFILYKITKTQCEMTVPLYTRVSQTTNFAGSRSGRYQQHDQETNWRIQIFCLSNQRGVNTTCVYLKPSWLSWKIVEKLNLFSNLKIQVLNKSEQQSGYKIKYREVQRRKTMLSLNGLLWNQTISKANVNVCNV